MPPLHPKLKERALKEGFFVGPGNTTPIQIGFAACTLPDEWSSTYTPLSQKYPQLQTSKQPQQLSTVRHSDGTTGLRFTSPSPTLPRSLFTFPRSPFLGDRVNHNNPSPSYTVDPTFNLPKISVPRNKFPQSASIIPRSMSVRHPAPPVKIDQPRRSTYHISDQCEYCVTSTFQTESPS